uniref:(northern house mosquito) hypothetical protein n=1 Tax=Culex pipiens TaxID=7175 RepID=A0A8D8L0J2_CULPI
MKSSTDEPKSGRLCEMTEKVVSEARANSKKCWSSPLNLDNLSCESELLMWTWQWCSFFSCSSWLKMARMAEASGLDSFAGGVVRPVRKLIKFSMYSSSVPFLETCSVFTNCNASKTAIFILSSCGKSGKIICNLNLPAT